MKMDVYEWKKSLESLAKKRDIMDKVIMIKKGKEYTYKEFLEFLENKKDELPIKIVSNGENLISAILSEDR
jgi:hypothetical protein